MDTNELNELLKQTKLPDGLTWYDLGHNITLHARDSETGNPLTWRMAYLTDGKGFWRVRLNHEDDAAAVNSAVAATLEKIRAYQDECRVTGTEIVCDPITGAMSRVPVPAKC